MKLYQEAGDAAGIAAQITNNGTTLMAMGDERAAAAAYRNALNMADARHDVVNMRLALRNLAVVYSQQGDEKVALSFFERSMALEGPAEDDRTLANNENIRARFCTA